MVFTLAGPPGVGKSTLSLAIAGDLPPRTTEPTVAPEFVGTTYESTSTTFKINIWSTPGSKALERITAPFFTNATTVIFVYDASNPSSLREIRDYYLPHFLDGAPKEAVVVILGNKVDLLPKDTTPADQPRRTTLLGEIQTKLEGRRVLILESCALDAASVRGLAAGLVTATLEAYGVDGLPIPKHNFEMGPDPGEDATRCCVIT